nr:MAG TPA: hypothetical protein [Caudoviricetes sp.]
MNHYFIYVFRQLIFSYKIRLYLSISGSKILFPFQIYLDLLHNG